MKWATIENCGDKINLQILIKSLDDGSWMVGAGMISSVEIYCQHDKLNETVENYSVFASQMDKL